MKKMFAVILSLLIVCSNTIALASNPFSKYQATLTKATGVSTMEEWLEFPETRALLTLLTAVDLANTLGQSNISVAFDLTAPSYVCTSNAGPLSILLSTQEHMLFQVYYFPGYSSGDYIAYNYSFYPDADSYANAVARQAASSGKDVYENAPDIMEQIIQMYTAPNQ